MSKDILTMAREAGFETKRNMVFVDATETTPTLERFAELVRVTEREECAKVADSMDPLQDGAIGAAILARGNTCEK